MTDEEFYDANLAPPFPYPPDATTEQKVEIETRELARLQGMNTDGMSERVRLWHRQAISDVYWRRRMATRTPEQIAAGVIAPEGPKP